MKRILSAVLAGAMVVSGAALGSAAMAFPAGTAKAELGSGLIDVQHRRGYYRHGPHVYHNGHRGSFRPRPGWRRYNDAWFPPAAFIAGAIIGGAIARELAPPPPPPVYRGGPAAGLPPAHVQWCAQRYRSYRAYDNTFQPYNGPRRPCRSPYF